MPNYRLLNYNQGDTVATGLYHPKTTAILFDKIWIPSDFRHSQYGRTLEYDKIPLSVCVIEEIEESIRSFNEVGFIRKALLEGKKIKEINFKDAEIDGLRIMPYVGQNRPFYTVEEDVLGLEFLFSGSRNVGLKQVVNSFKRIYGIEIVPVYLGHTAFEESLLVHDEEMAQFQLQRYKHNSGINAVFQFDLFPIPNLSEFEKQTTHSAYEVCLSNMPVIVEERLKWKQVLEMRKDAESMKKIHRFRRWVDLELDGKSKNEIIQSLEKAIDDYKYALKKHGVMTAIGGLTTVLSASSTVIEAFSGDFSAQMSAGLAISGGLITYTATQLNDYFEKKREPIALIYDLEKSSMTIMERLKNKLKQ
ncbi:hypothetical protein DWW70_14140 [Coprococcus sp. AF16-5]|uniref:hypothetical protein n=1 Tax=Coprococcus sp. AF16-5 TaxID=2293088 RepID=UPI000E52B50B|nr:hypothetical protein [Coprococcus sp. AF16-5]RHR64590.1 hypothetical protein DWW70_14140 [Coprococcus sp. AF16-5]